MAASEQTITPPTTASVKSWAPTAKVSAGILAASITTLALPVLNDAVKIDAAQAAALTTVITFAIQYWVPERQ